MSPFPPSHPSPVGGNPSMGTEGWPLPPRLSSALWDSDLMSLHVDQKAPARLHGYVLGCSCSLCSYCLCPLVYTALTYAAIPRGSLETKAQCEYRHDHSSSFLSSIHSHHSSLTGLCHAPLRNKAVNSNILPPAHSHAASAFPPCRHSVVSPSPSSVPQLSRCWPFTPYTPLVSLL